jgi:hypothetical protein
MQLSAFTIYELWQKENFEFFIYELTKTNKVLKHKIVDLIEFDDCIIIIIGDGKLYPKHRLIFPFGSSSKKQIGDSIFYTDLNAIKAKFSSKIEQDKLREDIAAHEKELKASSDHLNSKKKSLLRLEKGLNEDYFIALEQEDLKNKEIFIEHLKTTIYEYAARYGSDVSFTFLVDRLWEHSDKEIDKDEFIKKYEDYTCEKLNEELNVIIIEKINTEKIKVL